MLARSRGGNESGGRERRRDAYERKKGHNKGGGGARWQSGCRGGHGLRRHTEHEGKKLCEGKRAGRGLDDIVMRTSWWLGEMHLDGNIVQNELRERLLMSVSFHYHLHLWFRRNLCDWLYKWLFVCMCVHVCTYGEGRSSPLMTVICIMGSQALLMPEDRRGKERRKLFKRKLPSRKLGHF